jgi:hypothetical protein
VSGWREVVSKCLYSQFRDPDGKAKKDEYTAKVRSHPYLPNLGKLARSAALVITHNFDDALEHAIALDPATADTPAGRKYYSFWRPEPFLRSGMVNIYHPNGYIPLLRGKQSDSLILTEAGFADHLANANTEESHFLLRHLADKTFIIIGHSLSDATLKNALRQHANLRPGHVHYYVHWDERGAAGLSDDQQTAIRNANFETYNLITIFADDKDIADLLEIVSKDQKELEEFLTERSILPRYVYYIVGPVSAGKSTTLRHLRDLVTVEEWPNVMPVEMNRQSIGLNATQEHSIDERLEGAIWRKNIEIADVKIGIVAVDRAPLDFIAFPSKEGETMQETAKRRAAAALGRLARDDFRELCRGQVIVLEADREVLAYRQLQRGESSVTTESVNNGSAQRYLARQQQILADVYKVAIDGGSAVRTDRHPIGISLKAVARIIHLGEYAIFDVARRLREIQQEA